MRADYPASTPHELSAQRIKDLFAKHDSDGSGLIELYEFAGAITDFLGFPPSVKQLKEMMESTGSRDRNLSLHQFAALLRRFDWDEVERSHIWQGAEDPVTGNGNERLTAEHIKHLFTKHDSDGSGLIELYEFAGAITDFLGYPPSAKHLKEMMDSTGSRDRNLSLHEFAALLRRFEWDDDRRCHIWQGAEDPVSGKGGLRHRSDRDGGRRRSLGTAEDEAAIRRAFEACDKNLSGDLDTWELSNAMKVLVGRAPSTSQVQAMVAAAAAAESNEGRRGSDVSSSTASSGRSASSNRLTLSQFTDLVRTFHWDESEAEVHDTLVLGNGVYELEFQEQKLGFRVRAGGEGRSAAISVSQVTDPLLEGLVGVSDTVLAVNGAPLGFVTDHRVLAQKVGGLARPVRITFKRYTKPAPPGGSRNDSVSVSAIGSNEDYMASMPRDLSDERVTEVFMRFDHDASGDLSVFELSSAVAELLGRPPSTREAWSMVEISGAETSSLSLAQFAHLVRTFDWDAEDLREGLPPNLKEHWFEEGPLGFGLIIGTEEGGLVLLVSSVNDSSIKGVVEVGDKIVAINGAPLGYVDDAKVFFVLVFAPDSARDLVLILMLL